MSAVDPAERERKRRRHRNERIVAAIVVVVVAAAAWAIVRWNRAEQAALDADRRYIPRPVKITPELTMLQELVRIDSSKPEGVAASAKWIAAYLERNGIRAELIEPSPSMVSVYARVKGRSPGEALLLFSHIDVVPPGDGWGRDPFAASMFGDQVIGRGTLDMKALIVCQLVALADIVKSGRAPEHDLVFLATPDEETGSTWGMQWLLANRPDIFAGVAYGITEGGITEMTGEKMTYFGIETGGKQMVQAVIEAETREEISAARIALEPYMFPRTPGRVLPEVRTHLAHLSQSRLQFREHLADIDATIRDGKFWQLPATYRDLTQNSVGTGPPERNARGWHMVVTMVNLPDERPEERVAWLRRTIAPHAVVTSTPTMEGPVPISSEKTRLFDLLAAEAGDRYRVPAGVQILYRSSSDARFLRKRGIVCYGLSPYPVTFFQSTTIHKANEAIGAGYFQDGVEYLRDVVRKWSAN
jgi:acetylornithine deacetylase/succinyl-diaminopimelate desuccinylase-like protein